MAALRERDGRYQVLFCYYSKLCTFTIRNVEKDEAQGHTRQVDDLLTRLWRRLQVLPDGTNIVTFVEHDSEPPRTGPTPPAAPRQAILLWYRLIDFLGRGADGPKEFGVAAPA